MYNIYIIEDNITFANTTSEIIGNYADSHKNFTVSNCHVYSKDFDRFFNNIPKESNKHNIYILDIDLGSTTTTGIEIAKHIRRFDFDGYIIFLTAFEEYTGEVLSYNLKAINYIHKSSTTLIGSMTRTLDSILFESSETIKTQPLPLSPSPNKTLMLSYKGTTHKIDTNDILYVETHPLRRCLNIYLKDTIVEYRETLNNLVSLLPSHFVRCHKSYIININKVERIHLDQQNYIAYIDETRSCPISKRFVDKPLELLSNLN